MAIRYINIPRAFIKIKIQKRIIDNKKEFGRSHIKNIKKNKVHRKINKLTNKIARLQSKIINIILRYKIAVIKDMQEQNRCKDIFNKLSLIKTIKDL